MRINNEEVKEELVSLCNASPLCRDYCDADLNVLKSKHFGHELFPSNLKFLLFWSSLLRLI